MRLTLTVLQVVKNEDDLMQKICRCLDVFKVVVSQRNEELCPGGRFFNPFDGADKAFNVATDIDVHILRKIGGIVDDIEASFGQKKGNYCGIPVSILS